MIRRRRIRRRNRLRLAVLSLTAIFASVLIFRCFIPSSSESSSKCGGSECAAEVAGVSLTVTPASPPQVSFQGTTPPPSISAASAVVVEDSCGEVLFAKDPHRRLPPASITKIVTAIIAVETTQPDDIVNVNVDNFFAGDGTVMGLQTGMQMSMRDLLYGLLLPSGNDAAIAIARYVAGDVPSFVERMNAKVRELGLQDTNFTNPHGLDAAGHYSSAYDMAMIGRYAMKDPLIAEIVKTPSYTPNWDGGELWNGNLLLWQYPGADGIKTGWTDNAGQTMVATAQRDGRRLIVAIMDSQDRYTDAEQLLDWGFEYLATTPVESCDAVSGGAGQ